MTPARRAVLGYVAARLPDPGRLGRPARVAIDGVDGAGKTVFADDLAGLLGEEGRTVVRVGIDGFHRPRAWRHRRGRGSPEGFWLDSYDYPAFLAEVVAPLGPGGSREYRSAVRDLATDQVLDLPRERAPDGAVLLVDGIFLHRDELVGCWDYSVLLDVPFETSVARMATRDGTSPDPGHPSNRRYVEGQRLYLAACDPSSRATIVVDHTDVHSPVVTRG